jgi:hypothetical protein
MTRDEKALLLTVARVLRAKIADEIDRPVAIAHLRDDLWALCEALKPFAPSPIPGGDFEPLVRATPDTLRTMR